MAVDNSAHGARPEAGSFVVRRLLDDAAWASLATIDRVDGSPSVSLVQIALNEARWPIFLISELAAHTRNLRSDRRASLLVDRREQAGATAAVERVTLIGQAREIDSAADRERFLAKHPDAARYIDFSDFGLWELAIERAHLVAGFGRIRELRATDL